MSVVEQRQMEMPGSAPMEKLSVESLSRPSEGKRSPLGSLLRWAYVGVGLAMVRSWILNLITRLEGGELYSLSLRDIMRQCHGLDIGLYSDGGPFIPGQFRRGMKIGRFCTIARTVRAFNANHPMNLRSTHAFFYNPALGLVKEDLILRLPLEVGNDVFIGHNAIILPSVRSIGHGAVIGAGSVVHEDVPPFAVVVGHPARVVRYRFRKEIIAELLASRWWDRPLAEIAKDVESFTHPLDGGPVR